MEISEKDQKIVKRAKENKDFEPYFFEKIIEKKDIKWFNLLKGKGFFDISNIPTAKDNEYLEKWYLLEYIKSILTYEENNTQPDVIYEIKSLLKNISNKTNNYKVLQQSLEILYLIPVNLYDNQYLEEILNNLLTSSINIIPNILNFICKLINKEEFEKSICSLKIVINYMLFNNMRADYLMYGMNEYIEILYKNYSEELIKNFIEVIESYLLVEQSSRNIEDDRIQIKADAKYYTIEINDNVVLSHEFINKSSDLEKINVGIKSFKQYNNDQDVDKVTKLLYGDLFSKESLKSIYSDEIYSIDTFDYIVYLIKEIIEKYYYNSSSIQKTVIYMINNKYDFIIKLGLYGLNYLVKENNKLFDTIIESNKDQFNYIIRFYIFDEDIKYLFNSLTSINEKSIELIDDIIDQGEYINHNFGIEFNDIWKQKRYEALSKISYFNDKLKNIKEKTNMDVELRPCISIGEAYVIKDVSIITCNDIKQMSNYELVKKMKSFRPIKNHEVHEENSYRGFGIEIKKAIIQEPERFYESLDIFKDIPNEFMAYIIDAFDELITNNKNIKCRNLILLFFKYIERPEFWSDVDKHRYGYEVILKRIFRYLDRYLNNDKIEFDKEILNTILYILEICYTKINYEEYQSEIINNDDYLFYILNNLVCLNNMVLLSLALKIKRIDLNDMEKILNVQLFDLYNKLSRKCPRNLYLIMGYHISQLTYINEEWIKTKIVDDFNDREYFIIGYLLNSNVYEEYFKIMRPDYVKYIDTDYSDKNIINGLVGHIVISYFNKFKYGKELIDTLINKSDDNILLSIIKHCKMIKQENLLEVISYEEYTNNIMYIWVNINKILEEKTYKDLSKIMKEITGFISKFDNVNNDIKLILEKNLPYMSDDFYTYNLVNYLNIQKEKVEDENIYLLNIIKSFLCISTPIYPENEIQKLVDYINKYDKESIIDIYDCYLNKNKQYTFLGIYIRNILAE
ncbi:hypothetical protein [Terrisporobacter glycolicus]|uniref:Uncharacterized protein n=1 Tax=Terrisporobacter glycolicus ATCC 14880 = DSM 1288 TaxID=1121315 RepID=A0ABZ2EQK6_9FIRM|nr:hypothetical protein [Terrisporobacter glycolicus]